VLLLQPVAEDEPEAEPESLPSTELQWDVAEPGEGVELFPTFEAAGPSPAPPADAEAMP
jgi:hypothetical protein